MTTAETRGSIRWFNAGFGLTLVYQRVCTPTGTFFTGYALYLGIAKEQMGLVATIAGMAFFMQILGMLLADRMADRKRFLVWMAVLEPAFFLGAVLGPLIVPEGWRFFTVLAFLFASGAVSQTVLSLGSEWIASIVPAGIRGRYLGIRMRLTEGAGIVGLLVAGFIVDSVPGESGLVVTLSLFAVLAMGSGACLNHVGMPEISTASKVSLRSAWEPLHNKPFRNYCAAHVVLNLPFIMAYAYYGVFHLEILGMSFLAVTWLFTIYQLAKISIAKVVGRYCDRWGPRRSIRAAFPFYFLFLGTYAFAPTDQVWMFYGIWIIMGLADAVWMVAMSAALFEVAPDNQERPAYFVVDSIIITAVTIAGPMIAIPVLKWLSDGMAIGTWHFDQFPALFLICTLMIIPAWFSARLLPMSSKGKTRNKD